MVAKKKTFNYGLRCWLEMVAFVLNWWWWTSSPEHTHTIRADSILWLTLSLSLPGQARIVQAMRSIRAGQ